MPEVLIVDGPRLRQILTNLTGNALKFTHHGEVMLAIEPTESEGHWRFRIRDSGIGIPMEKQKPFSRRSAGPIALPPAATAVLALADHFCPPVSLMGGELTVQSEPGEGSEFALRCHWKVSWLSQQPMLL